MQFVSLRAHLFTLHHIRRFLTTPHIRSTDPWPLPGTPQHMASSISHPDLPRPIPVPRHNESIETLRARLVYQTRKRGTLESDLILSTFAQDQLTTFSEQELREFDKLLDEPDWDVYYWCTGGKAPPARWRDSVVLEKLKIHVRNEGKAVRRMPDLHAMSRSSVN